MSVTTFHSAYAGSMYPDSEIDEYGYMRYQDYAQLERVAEEMARELKELRDLAAIVECDEGLITDTVCAKADAALAAYKALKEK